MFKKKSLKFIVSLILVLIIITITIIFTKKDDDIKNSKYIQKLDIKKDFNINIDKKEPYKDLSYTNSGLDFNLIDKSKIPKLKIISKEPKLSKKSDKPLLAIIIDDVSVKRELNNINSLNLTINKSFLPPDKHHKNSAKLANSEKNFIVHIPLQAPASFTATEDIVLNINDSYNYMNRYIQKLKSEFNNIKYINNHTGSLFTSNYKASKNLLTILKKENIQFIDSKTTSKSKIQKISKELNLKYLSRNVFLDDRRDVSYIKKQIDTAIRVAKKRGQAIAIGHPHKETIKALWLSRQKLLKNVRLVYLNELK